MRIIALRLLAAAGGPRALEAVQAALGDRDVEVQGEAVRTLSTWPNNWPEDSGVAQPLLTLARSGSTPSYQVLGLRGYLQYVQVDRQLKDDQKVSRVTEVLPLIKRPEEKRLAIAAVGAIPTADALQLLMTFASDSAVAEDACSAILKLTDPAPPAVSREQRQEALQTVTKTSTSEATRKKASELLKATQ